MLYEAETTWLQIKEWQDMLADIPYLEKDTRAFSTNTSLLWELPIHDDFVNTTLGDQQGRQAQHLLPSLLLSHLTPMQSPG